MNQVFRFNELLIKNSLYPLHAENNVFIYPYVRVQELLLLILLQSDFLFLYTFCVNINK